MSTDIDPAEQPFEYYIEHLLEDRSLTDRRERNYRNTVSNLQAFLEDRPHSSTNDLDISDVRGFVKHLTEDCDLALSTVEINLTAINKLYKDI
jgi:site-specific recombinase XerD